jgi:hypothetical protein
MFMMYPLDFKVTGKSLKLQALDSLSLTGRSRLGYCRLVAIALMMTLFPLSHLAHPGYRWWYHSATEGALNA